MRHQIDIEINHQADIGELRRQAVALARQATADETRMGHVALVASELGSNVLVHAGGRGQILVRLNFDAGQAQSIDLLAIDTGPGISDIDRALADGYSTAGTPGTGLGAVRRLSHQFDIYSRPGAGTIVFSRLLLTEPANEGDLIIDGLRLPAPKESLCGDHYAWKREGPLLCALLVDALGHGPKAAEAADRAVALFQALPVVLPPDEVCRRLHTGLRSTRGAALAVVQIDGRSRQLHFAGIGNIAGRLVSAEGNRQLLSQPGIAGHALPNASRECHPFHPGSRLYLHSDGLVSRWDLTACAGLEDHHPLVQCATLLRDFRRRGDDASMLVMQWRES